MISLYYSLWILPGLYEIANATIRKERARIIFPLLIATICFVAIFRIGDSLPDYATYIDYIDSVTRGYEVFIESSFVWVVRTFYTDIFKEYGVFAFYAIVSIFIKMISIRKMSSLVVLAIVVYLSNIYIVQDLIQIRAGVASALFLFSVYYYVSNKTKVAIFLNVLAIIFHISAIIGLIIFFFNKKSINTRVWTAFLPISFVIAALGLINATLLKVIPGDKLSIYIITSESESINIYNVLFLCKFAICLYILRHGKQLSEISKYFPLLCKIYVLSICAFLCLSPLPTLAFRSQGYLEVVEIVLFPMIAFTFSKLWLGKAVVFFYSAFSSLVLIFNTKLIRF